MALSERLRKLGLAEDTSPDAPLCRWRRDELIVDVMPVNEDILGFSNVWYSTAIETAQTFDIALHDVKVVTPALFIATKLEAFHGRGADDMQASTAERTQFTEALAGFLLPDAASQARRGLIEDRLRQIATA